MKTITSLFAVAATCALFLVADSAFAQLGRGNLGAKLRSRTQARVGVQNEIEGTNAVEIPLESTATQATSSVQSSAQSSTNAAAQASSAQSAETSVRAPLKKSDGSEFVIPANASPKDLIAKANDLMSTEVAFETQEEYDAWIAKMFETVSKIADLILKTKSLEDADFISGVSLKGQVLCYQASLDSKYLPKLGAYADLLEKNKRIQSLDDGRDAALAFKGVYLQALVADIAERNGTAEELTKVMDEVAQFIAANPKTSDMTVDLVYPISVVAANQKDEGLVDKIWDPIRKQLAASKDESSKLALQMLEGTIRYSKLEGNPFEWQGCDVNGKPLDVSLIKGRIVVVDFWASWNPACAQQHAGLLELYKKYKDQGLEIVSYNLDGQLKDMEEYAKKNQMPWINLSDRATVDAKKTSLAAYYGVSEIPTMILIGGDGNVAGLDITMEALEATLDNVFKTAAQSSAAPAKTATGKNSAAGSNATNTQKSARRAR